MTRRYGILFVVMVAIALVAVAVSRMPRAPHDATVEVEAAEPLALDVFQDRVVTTPSAIPVGRRIELTVVNHTDRPARITLAGYEDRVSHPGLGPDSTWTTTFVANRPGEQFAWIVDDEPRGRLDVAGSHLVEGHR